jgi:hypothetical protein
MQLKPWCIPGLFAGHIFLDFGVVPELFGKFGCRPGILFAALSFDGKKQVIFT